MDIKLLELNGVSIFALRSGGGGLTVSFIAYLIATHNDIEYSFPIEIIPKKGININKITINNITPILMDKFDELVNIFRLRILNGTANKANFSGGDLGRASDNGIVIGIE